MKRKLLLLVLVIATMLTATGCLSCIAFIKDTLSEDDEPAEEGVVFYGDEGILPDLWVDGVLRYEDAVNVQIAPGEGRDVSELFGAFVADAVWYSECDAVASVDNGVVKGNKIGRTTVSAYLGDELLARGVVTVEAPVIFTGYNFDTNKRYGDTHKVNSLREANGILDKAIAEHCSSVVIDFSPISASFNADRDFVLDSELGCHVSLKTAYNRSRPYIVEFQIVYNKDAATYTTPLTAENTCESVQSANAMIRRALYAAGGDVRADDFDGFKINLRENEYEVYNSEELWWAVEHGYKPVFPIKGTRAELIYERAKMVLRDIITEDMTEYERVLAIYEYLIEAVAYDYDAAESMKSASEEKKNTCYYLEGVFEIGRAVCDGKSKAFVLLCGIEGIDCVRAFGAASGNVGHAWNYVELDGVWYTVDTTGGDVKYDDDTNPAKFFGGQFETVDYYYFLAPAYIYYGQYDYTDLWAHLIPASKNYEYGEDYLGIDIANTEYDFIINSTSELDALLTALSTSGMPDKFILSFKPYNQMRLREYFANVKLRWGLEFELYTVGDGVYAALFTRSVK